MGNALLYPIRQFRALVYDVLILKLTTKWYEAVLSQLDEGSTVLDVGIGTAGALLRCKDLILDRKLRIVGLDYDADYVMKARQAIAEANLEHCVSVVDMSVYDVQRLQSQLSIPRDEANTAPRFDIIYFSGSFSLLPDKPGALIAVMPLLKKNPGRIYITQTYQRYAPPLLSYLKPLLRYITTIDFGQLVLEEKATEFFEKEVPDKCQLECAQHGVIKGSVDSFMQAAYLTILKTKP